VQYARWLGRILSGDLGYSYRAHIPVTTLIAQRLPATLLLLVAALSLSVIVAVPLGVAAAVRRDTIVDFGAMAGGLLALSVPPFASGIFLVLLFGVALGWLPTMGFPRPGAGPLTILKYLTLPTVTLAAGVIGLTMRLTRSTMLEELGRDYVRTAHAKGLNERAVVFRHVLRNALIPIITLVGLQASFLVGGAVVIETIFAWPGIGSLIIDAILARDYPIVQSVVLLVAVMVVVVSVLIDMTYSVLDPRIRLS
jgi:peptide/nickel transport system permease protein